MKILQTKDYDMFTFIKGNRNINIAKLTKIMNDISDGFNMLQYCPIICSEKEGKLLIIDGQHRFEISKRIEQPVYYVVCSDITLLQIATLNSRTDKWKWNDFLNCYISIGYLDYIELKKFIDKYKVKPSVATGLLMDFNVKSRNSDFKFIDGNFKVNYLQEASALIEFTEFYFSRYIFSKDRFLIGAVQLLQKKGIIDWERFALKLSQKPMLMDKQGDVKQYILNIERIYNDGLQNRILLT